MNTFKPNQCTIFYRPLAIKGRLLMSVSLVVGFSLRDGSLVNEQDFWGLIQPQLQGSVLDDGLPKPHAEFLVAGSCHAPAGQTLKRAEVRFQVGRVEKRLAVFGDRLWRRGGIGMTEPQEFTSMPLSWEYSFGHARYADNPLGRGLIAGDAPSDGVFLLPNIEYRDHLIVDTADRPRPAAPLPMPANWPVRSRKAGTYGDAWLRDRWPWFPDDIDWEYCNAAPEDQYIDGFFQGGEAIRVTGMHPDFQDIQSQVPHLRPRCFATVKQDAKASAEQDVFRELDLKADTLWLFPGVMTGALVFHGTTPVQDEEFDDVRYCYAVLEDPESPPAPLDEHLYQQWIKAAEVTPNFFGGELGLKEAEVVMTALWMQRAKSRLEKTARMVMNDQPVMPFSEARVRGTVSKIFGSMRRGYDKGVKDLLKMPQSGEVRRWLARTASKRDKLYIKERRTMKLIDGQLRQQHESLLEMAKKMPDSLKPGTLDEMIGAMQKKESVNLWHDRGFALAAECRERMELDDNCLAAIERMGFTAATLEESWFGYLPDSVRERSENWGLEPESEEFTVPSGLLLPRFSGAVLTRLAVIEGWTPETSLIEAALLPLWLVPGSDKTPLLFDSPNPGAPIVIVPGELEAWYLDEKLGGICSVLVLPGADKGPDPQALSAIDEKTQALLKNARAMLVVLPQGQKAGESELASWRVLHPEPLLVRLPQAETVLEAEESGINLERLVQAHLSPALLGVSEDALGGKGREPMEEAEDLFKKSINAIALAQLDKTEASLAGTPLAVEAKPHLDKARRKIAHPEEFKEEKESSNVKVHLRKQKKSLLEQREMLAGQGMLTPEVDEKIQKGLQGLDKAAGIVDEVRASLLGKAAPKAEQEPCMEEDIPDRLTRESVISLHARGISLDGQDLSELDLSGLDLSGIRLAFASLDETNFRGTLLHGADFSGVNTQRADFSGADLRGSVLNMVSMDRCIMKGSCLDECKFDRASFDACDCTEASFRNAEFHMASLGKCVMDEAVFDQASFKLSSLSGKARKASFQGSTHFQTGFSNLELDSSTFARAVLDNVRFFVCSGQETVFYEANLDNAMFHQCRLPEADFRRVRMLNGTVAESGMPGANFTGSIIKGSLMEKSEFHGAQFYGVNAEESMFIKSDLEDADMRGSNFMAASFSGSRLVQTNLRMANCFGAEFRRAVFGNAFLDGANLRQTLLEGREGLIR